MSIYSTKVFDRFVRIIPAAKLSDKFMNSSNKFLSATYEKSAPWNRPFSISCENLPQIWQRILWLLSQKMSNTTKKLKAFIYGPLSLIRYQICSWDFFGHFFSIIPTIGSLLPGYNTRYAGENVLKYSWLPIWAILHDVSKSSWLHFQVMNVMVVSSLN